MADDFDAREAQYNRLPWMTDDQFACAKMFAKVVGGFHHVGGDFKPHGCGIKVHTYSGGWSTWDFNLLTRLVVLAHDQMIRVELIPSGPRVIGFGLWQRHSREGGVAERHPTIEAAIAMHRPKMEAPTHG